MKESYQRGWIGLNLLLEGWGRQHISMCNPNMTNKILDLRIDASNSSQIFYRTFFPSSKDVSRPHRCGSSIKQRVEWPNFNLLIHWLKVGVSYNSNGLDKWIMAKNVWFVFFEIASLSKYWKRMGILSTLGSWKKREMIMSNHVPRNTQVAFGTLRAYRWLCLFVFLLLLQSTCCVLSFFVKLSPFQKESNQYL